MASVLREVPHLGLCQIVAFIVLVSASVGSPCL
jgi:hypothetical protein